MATVVVDQMRDRLLTIEEAHDRLRLTEPLGVVPVTSDEKVTFRFSPGWETTLPAATPTEAVEAFITVNGDEHQLTREGVEQAANLVNVTKKNLQTLPAHITEQALNHFYADLGDKDAYNMLTVKGLGSAFTGYKSVPFSTINLFEKTIEGIRDYYGANTEVLVDYKFENSLAEANINLIVPEAQRIIRDGGLNDVPGGQSDLWSTGVHLTNSLSAKVPTAVESYLFRWWCTNGAIENLGAVGTWNRKSNGQTDDVYEWARTSVDEVLGGMEERFNRVQRLTEIEMTGGSTGDILSQIFKQYKIPVAQRDSIQNTLLSADRINMYAIMAAITQAANEQGLNPGRADALMRVGGAIPTGIYTSDKAQVWAEGHESDPEATNPYEIKVG